MAEGGISPEYAQDHRRLRQLRDYRFNPRVVLDVGASNGVWSATCADVFPEAEYFLVEPQRYPVLDPFPPATRHHWIHQAVGRTEGQVELKMPDGKSARYNAHIKSKPATEAQVASRLKVPQTTVNQLLESGAIAPPHLVKLDVQGYELEVMEGASKLWDSAKIFVVETSFYRYWGDSPVFEEVVAYFAQHNFYVCEISTECRVAPSNILSQIDLIFAPRAVKMSRVMVPHSYPLWDGTEEGRSRV